MATDPQSLLSSANCYDCFLPQYAIMELSLLRQILLALNPSAMTDPQSLINQGNCYQCYLPQYQLMVLALLSQISGSIGGGGSGGGIIQCGTGIPIAAPGTGCSLYIRQEGAMTALYAWDGAHWQAIVGT